MIRVCVINVQPILLRGLVKALSGQGLRVVNATTTAPSGIPWLADVVLLDPDALPADRRLPYVKDLAKVTAVVMYTTCRRAPAAAYLDAGAVAVLDEQDPAEVVTATVRAAVAGALPRGLPGAAGQPGADPTLSKRESQVLLHISLGLTHHQVANRLGISQHTVDTYVKRIRVKLGLGNKAELTRAAVRGMAWI